MIPPVEERQHLPCAGCIIHHYCKVIGTDWENFCRERHHTTHIQYPCKYRITLAQFKELIDSGVIE